MLDAVHRRKNLLVNDLILNISQVRGLQEQYNQTSNQNQDRKKEFLTIRNENHSYKLF